MKEWPLREEFRDHRTHVDVRFDRLERKLDQFADRLAEHDHPEYWTALQILTAISVIASLVGGLILIFA